MEEALGRESGNFSGRPRVQALLALLLAGLTNAEPIVAGSIVLAAASIGVAALALAFAGKLFQRDAILYGE
jgi:hypothetical protein